MCDWPAHPVAVASPWIWREALPPACSLGLLWEAFMGFISSCWMAPSSLPLWKESTEKTYTTRIRSKIIIQSQHKEADRVPLATTEEEKRILFCFCSLGFWAHPCGLLWVSVFWEDLLGGALLHKTSCPPKFQGKIPHSPSSPPCNCVSSTPWFFCYPSTNSHHKSRSAGLEINSFWSHATWNKPCFGGRLDALWKDRHLPSSLSWTRNEGQHD